MCFYHMRAAKLEIGAVIKPKGAPHVDPLVEAILNHHRPEGCLPRDDVVYLSEPQDSARHGLTYDAGFLHIVEPADEVQKRDNYWIGQLQLRHHSDPRFVALQDKSLRGLSDEQMVENYFNGVPSPKPNWEYVASEATVTGLVSDEAIEIHKSYL